MFEPFLKSIFYFLRWVFRKYNIELVIWNSFDMKSTFFIDRLRHWVKTFAFYFFGEDYKNLKKIDVDVTFHINHIKPKDKDNK